MPPREFRLAVLVPSLNRVFITEKMNTTEFNSYYKVDLKDDGTVFIVESSSGMQITQLSSALGITLVVELLVALVFTRKFKSGEMNRLLLSVAVANLISLPIVWISCDPKFQGVFSIFYFIIFLAAEAFAWVFEAVFIYLLNRKSISFIDSVLLSFCMNFSSFAFGVVLVILEFMGVLGIGIVVFPVL